MVVYRTSADIPEDRRLILNLPADIPTGEVEVVVTVAPKTCEESQPGSVRQLFGSLKSENPKSGDNDQIDQDLGNAYRGKEE